MYSVSCLCFYSKKIYLAWLLYTPQFSVCMCGSVLYIPTCILFEKNDQALLCKQYQIIIIIIIPLFNNKIHIYDNDNRNSCKKPVLKCSDNKKPYRFTCHFSLYTPSIQKLDVYGYTIQSV